MNKSQLHGEPGRSGKGLRGALTGLLGAALLCIPVPALACTLYAAQGTAVADGGTIAAKNRDWRPQEQSLHLSEPRQPGGYRYYGLYGGPFERHQLRGGVNEAGLVAYSAAVSSVTKKQKAAAAEAHPPVQGTLRKVLERYATVEEAVQHPELFQGVRFVMLADRSEVAWIEGGLDGEVRIERRQNGVLAHTNHYLIADLAAQMRSIMRAAINAMTGSWNCCRLKNSIRSLISFASARIRPPVRSIRYGVQAMRRAIHRQWLNGSLAASGRRFHGLCEIPGRS